jgi:hypothetical protein
MKALTIIATCLFVAALAYGECVTIAVPGRPSYQNVRLEVLRNGKPQPNVTLAVVGQFDSKLARPAITTDVHGMAKLENLSPGDYCINATAEPRLADTLCLNVSKGSDAKLSKFSMLLSPVPPPPPTLEERVKEAEKRSIELRGQTFKGLVTDISGAGIPRVEIAVYRRASMEKQNPTKLSAGDDGGFSAQLNPGKYTAVFQSQGFSTRFVAVEIGPEAPKQNMTVTLQIRNDGC